MPVSLEFINIIIDLSCFDKKHGNRSMILDEIREDIGSVIWHDEFILRDGAMSMDDACKALRWWARRGVRPFSRDTNNKRVWHDCCVVMSPFGDTAIPCSWLKISNDSSQAAHVNDNSRLLVGRTKFGDGEDLEEIDLSNLP